MMLIGNINRFNRHIRFFSEEMILSTFYKQNGKKNPLKMINISFGSGWPHQQKVSIFSAISLNYGKG